MASWGRSSAAFPSQAAANPHASSSRGAGPSRGRGSGRGGGGSSGRGGARGGRGGHRGAPRRRDDDDDDEVPVFQHGRSGALVCGHAEGAEPCGWRSDDATAMTLHRADRHLILPPGGREELERIDPIAREERKERMKKERRRARDGSEDDDEEDGPVIAGLNIALSTPELVAMWIRERKKRWPSAANVARKREEAWDEDARGMTRGRMPVKRPRVEEPAKAEAAPVESHEATMPAPKVEAVQPAPATAPSASDDEDDSDDDGPPEETTSRAPDPALPASPSGSSSDSFDDSDDDQPAVAPEPQVAAEEPDASAATGPTPEETLARPSAPTCRFWLQGRCNYGAQCKSQHRQPAAAPVARRNAAPAGEKRRVRPRAPPPNPFQAPHALRALLANEIAQHVNYVAQVVRFLVRNDALCGVEGSPGEAEEQRKRRGMVQMLDEHGQPEVANEETPVPSAPLHDGGLPTVPSTSTPGAASLFRPASPLLRPLDSLSYPPEPDPMIFLDPLRAADVKPLTREQVLDIATDAPLRALLYPAEQAALTPHGTHQRVAPALWRALETLDALPSAAHRAAALELILGVSEQSPLHAHQLGATYVRQHASGGNRPRVIGETELFRLGLRVSPDEVAVLRALAQRVSELVGAVEFAAHEGAPRLGAPAQADDGGRAFRDAQRALEYEHMAQKQDLLRSLGIDVD